MIKKIIFSLLVTAVFLTGCKLFEERRINTEKVNFIDLGILESSFGEYVVGDLTITPRVALMAEEYAKAETTLPGERLTISSEAVHFDEEKFYCTSAEKMDWEETRSYFNITGGQSNILCGDNLDEHGVSTGHIEVYLFSTMDQSKWITLILKEDAELMLWVGEKYTYIGFYELIRQE